MPEAASDAAPEITGVAQTFDAEPIDRFWRSNTEATIRAHMPHLADLECHQTLCRLTATGAEADVERSFEAMRGVSDSLLFTAPETRPDGTIALRAYARFTRTE